MSARNCEKMHLNFLKWAVGVNRKESNSTVWGQPGRYPLVIECLNMTLNYAKRLEDMKDDSLVKLAYKEQKALELDWYRGNITYPKYKPTFQQRPYHFIQDAHKKKYHQSYQC